MPKASTQDHRTLYLCQLTKFYSLISKLLTYLALRCSGPWQDNGQQEFAICSCL